MSLFHRGQCAVKTPNDKVMRTTFIAYYQNKYQISTIA